MDGQFQKIHVEAIHQYNQGLRLKEPFTTNELELEMGLLHIEIKKTHPKIS